MNDISANDAVEEVELVSRSNVPSGLDYTKYKNYLRHDFFYSCAYCTMSEAEASAIPFSIDHYESQVARPDLRNDYNNLMYACIPCNTRKSDRTVPAAARKDGIHFFRPDEDKFTEHFIRDGLLLKDISKCGEFTIDALDLNRAMLRRLREIRDRLHNCDEMVAQGIRALRGFRIDQLPPNIRIAAMKAIRQVDQTQISVASNLDNILLYVFNDF